jgi:outer membrane protein TolC
LPANVYAATGVNFSQSTSLCLIALLCLFSGCSWLPSSHSSPLPLEVTAEGIRSQALASVTLDSVDQPISSSTAEGRASERLPSINGDRTPSRSPDVPAQVEEFTLRQAILFGLRNNPRLQAALASIDRARGEEQTAFAPFLPEIDLLTHGGVTSPSLGPASAGATGIILPTTFDTHTYNQAEVQLQWTLYDFGRTAGRFRQAEARTRIAELQSQRAEETIAFDVATAYLLALRAGALRVIQEEAIRRAETTLRDIRSRRAAGVAEKDDVLRGEVQLAASKEDLVIAREAELAALARLNNAMGRNAGVPVRIVDCKSYPPLNVSLVQSLEVASTRRPEIGVAREAVAAAQAGRDAKAAEFLPKVYARAVVGAIGGANIATGEQEGAGLHIDMPLFAGGKYRGELRSANAEIRQSLADARTILDGVTLQVTLAFLAANTARQRIDLDLPAIEEARENLRLVGNRYRNGTATPTDIVDAETALTRASQRLASATYEYLGALVGLDYALGTRPGDILGLIDRSADKDDTQTLPAPRPLPKMQ